MTDKLLCIYHAGCADGFGAAYAVWKQYPDAEFHAAKYGDEPPGHYNRDVVIVDFSYPEGVLRDMRRNARSLTVLDHHKTAEESLRHLISAGVIKGQFDMERSGAVIAWQYFHEGPDATPVPDLLLHIQDRDLWKFEIPGTREIMLALFSYEMDFQVWDALMELPVEELFRDGVVIDRYYDKNLRELLAATKARMRIDEFDVPVANVPYFMASDAGHLMAQGEPFCATYYDTATHRVFSLRSEEVGVDVSEIAKRLGGGGHKHAAGFRIPIGSILGGGEWQCLKS